MIKSPSKDRENDLQKAQCFSLFSISAISDNVKNVKEWDLQPTTSSELKVAKIQWEKIIFSKITNDRLRRRLGIDESDLVTSGYQKRIRESIRMNRIVATHEKIKRLKSQVTPLEDFTVQEVIRNGKIVWEKDLRLYHDETAKVTRQSNDRTNLHIDLLLLKKCGIEYRLELSHTHPNKYSVDVIFSNSRRDTILTYIGPEVPHISSILGYIILRKFELKRLVAIEASLDPSFLAFLRSCANSFDPKVSKEITIKQEYQFIDKALLRQIVEKSSFNCEDYRRILDCLRTNSIQMLVCEVLLMVFKVEGKFLEEEANDLSLFVEDSLLVKIEGASDMRKSYRRLKALLFESIDDTIDNIERRKKQQELSNPIEHYKSKNPSPNVKEKAQYLPEAIPLFVPMNYRTLSFSRIKTTLEKYSELEPSQLMYHKSNFTQLEKNCIISIVVFLRTICYERTHSDIARCLLEKDSIQYLVRYSEQPQEVLFIKSLLILQKALGCSVALKNVLLILGKDIESKTISLSDDSINNDSEEISEQAFSEQVDGTEEDEKVIQPTNGQSQETEDELDSIDSGVSKRRPFNHFVLEDTISSSSSIHNSPKKAFLRKRGKINKIIEVSDSD